ncbi:hypothetical protein HNQ59_003947 [Chitinivorax tropicus]|uniref:Uncharacterized protein n=1 Tax=Chitinivorax tropicus TaxID=714531 RepID=A0A840MUZ0_9PROT|nr:hypothetical protein [Chitinivorax tropicus]MBB5020622.1 hypothetical protein [Chitinivorax tropicus]
MHTICNEEKIVYELAKYLVAHPEQVAMTQALTLNVAKPHMGLLGSEGLYGSKEWWQSIKDGRIEVRTFKGTIQRLYVAGQDADEDEGKDFEYLCEDGRVRTESCVANYNADLELYREGAVVTLVYALDKLKKQPARNGGINFAEILLEVAIS